MKVRRTSRREGSSFVFSPHLEARSTYEYTPSSHLLDAVGPEITQWGQRSEHHERRDHGLVVHITAEVIRQVSTNRARDEPCNLR